MKKPNTIISKTIKGKKSRDLLVARLHFRHTTSNIYLTLTDINDRILYTRSTGMQTEAKNKRERVCIPVFELMTTAIVNKLNLLKINKLQIIMRSRLRRYFVTMLRLLVQYGIKIVKMFNIPYIPHNGVRGKKQRRK
jgi:ribosomal protein S11